MVSAHNYVCKFDFVPRIWGRLHDKDCLYIPSSSKNSPSYTVTYRGSTHSLSYIWLPAVNPRKFIHYATFFFLVLPFWLNLLQPRTQPQKFRLISKETNKQHGRRHMPSRTHCYIYIFIDTLHEILSPHTFYSRHDSLNI